MKSLRSWRNEWNRSTKKSTVPLHLLSRVMEKAQHRMQSVAPWSFIVALQLVIWFVKFVTFVIFLTIFGSSNLGFYSRRGQESSSSSTNSEFDPRGVLLCHVEVDLVPPSTRWRLETCGCLNSLRVGSELLCIPWAPVGLVGTLIGCLAFAP